MPNFVDQKMGNQIRKILPVLAQKVEDAVRIEEQHVVDATGNSIIVRLSRYTDIDQARRTTSPASYHGKFPCPESLQHKQHHNLHEPAAVPE